MELNDYHKKRNKEAIAALKLQQLYPPTLEEVEAQFKRIREGRKEETNQKNNDSSNDVYLFALENS